MNVQDGGIITWSKVVIVIFLIAVVLVLWKRLKDQKTVRAYLPMLLVAFYPYIWYLVMSNHSQIHYWYTYRAQLVTLFGGLVFLCAILREKKNDGISQGVSDVPDR